MPEINAALGRVNLRPQSDALAASANERSGIFSFGGDVDISFLRPPDSYVYVFSIAKRKFELEIPPCLPHVYLFACEEDEEYRVVMKIPQPFYQHYLGIESPEFRAVGIDARKLAQDVIDPDHPYFEGYNPDSEVAKPTGINRNLSVQGLFWVEEKDCTKEGNKVIPPKKALDDAHRRRETYYRRLLDEATALEMTNREELQFKISYNPDYRFAAEYFGEETSWHKTRVKAVKCPNCGSDIKPGLAFHSIGDTICVLDWHRAVASGVKKREDVPIELRWWEKDEKK